MKKAILVITTITAVALGIAAVAVAAILGDNFLSMVLGFLAIPLLTACFFLEDSIEEDRWRMEEEIKRERRRQIMIEQMDMQYLEEFDDAL